MKRKLTMFLALFFIGVGIMTAQTNINVRGTVVDESNEPVIGATVQIKGTSQGAITDHLGAFALTAPSNGTLVVSYVGMITRETAVAPTVKVVLIEDSELLEEVMVVAFGTAKKSAFTGSAKVVGTEKLEKSQVTSITNALAGAVPGVQLTSTSGAPGASSSIKIRGFSSLNAGNDPLIIVDGAPYSGAISNINPNDVESMTVLKDAASNALYGARGANGVVIITTKQAQRGRDAEITFDAKIGGNQRALKQYNIITDPGHYYETHYGALSKYYQNQGATATEAWKRANDNLFGDQGNGGLGYNVFTYPEGHTLIGMNGRLHPEATLGRTVNYRGHDYLVTPDDWANIGYRTGNRQDYNLSVSGGSERSTFYASLGYLKNEGITDGSNHDRLTGRIRTDYQAKKWLKVGTTMSFAKYESNVLANNGSSGSSGNIWAFTSQMAPIYPAYIRNADGSHYIDANGFQVMDYGDGKNAGMARPFISNANPIMDNHLNTRNSEGYSTNGNVFANINLMKGLTATVNLSFNHDEYRSTTVLNPYYGQFDTTGGTVIKGHYRTVDYTAQQLLNYNTAFADVHNLEVLLGHEYYNVDSYGMSASKSKMLSPDNKELGGAVQDGQSAGSSKSRLNDEGYFGRVQYDYDNRMFASASYRRHASSRFHPDHRWGDFWSLGGAWLINKEEWFDAPWVDELKVKASYGVQGNDNIGTYLYTDLFNIVNSDGEIGTSFERKGNKEITWETNSNFNIGTEFQLFRRITGSLEYYYRKTTDMLYSFSVAPSLGYTSFYDNIGDMYNTGFELELGANIISNKNVTWDVNLNASTLKNRITLLHEDNQNASLYDADGKEYKGTNYGSFFISEGVSIYTWRQKEFAGIAEDGQSMWYMNKKDDNGDLIKDERGRVERETTKAYADADYYLTNESTLPKLFGGFGTTVRFYGFDLSANFTYQLGGKQYDGTYASFMAPPTASSTGYNFHADVLKSWTPENPSNDIPRFVFGDTYGAGSSTRFLTSSSYLNVQNINFGYTLPAKLTREMQINSIRLYVSAENVAYWSKRKGFDPRQGFSGGTNATNYSPMRTISGGITIKF